MELARHYEKRAVAIYQDARKFVKVKTTSQIINLCSFPLASK